MAPTPLRADATLRLAAGFKLERTDEARFWLHQKNGERVMLSETAGRLLMLCDGRHTLTDLIRSPEPTRSDLQSSPAAEFLSTALEIGWLKMRS